MRTITIEEHYMASVFAERLKLGDLNLERPDDELRDLGKGRLEAMDAGGIDMQVLSQTTRNKVASAEEWIPLAEKANGELAAAVEAHPDRYAAFATLPMNDPGAAADELERTVTDHGFVGALMNGTTEGQFLDHARFRPLLERAADLDVPLYLHPGLPPEPIYETYYEGFEATVGFTLSTTAWGWHAEAGLHALRLIASGVFDELPNLKIIVGHMGEMIPFMLDRTDRWLNRVLPTLEHDVARYFREHFWVTTSGMFSQNSLMTVLRAVGADNVLFSIDYPYSSMEQGREFLDAIELAPRDVEKITHRNAERLLGLPEN